jgi:asparagine synthase (glutamine-hydrolysing)
MALLPSNYKVRRLRLKHLFKAAAQDILPPEIVNRPKAGFHVPVPAWLKGELRPLVERQLGPERLERQGVFDPSYVRQMLNEHYIGRSNLSRNIWGLLMFGLWYDRYLDG